MRRRRVFACLVAGVLAGPLTSPADAGTEHRLGSWPHHGPPASVAKLAPDTVASPTSQPEALAGIRRTVDETDAAGRRSVVVEGDDPAALAQAVEDAGGEVLVSAPGAVQAQVPPSSLDALANEPSVSLVRRPRAPLAAATSQGVASTGAAAWHATSGDGTGTKVGIIDIGFAGYATKLGNELPAQVGTKNLCGVGDTGFDGSGPSGTFTPNPHGTAVAEIVHDMAPGAALYLVCIDDAVDYFEAAYYFRDQGVTIVDVSLGDAIGGRGDGGTGVAAQAAQAARQLGQLWTVSAGNLAARHFAADVTDYDGDGFFEMFAGAQDPHGPDTPEVYTYNVAPGAVSYVQMKWDRWPVTNWDYDVYVFVDVIDGAHLLDCSYGGCTKQGNLGAPFQEPTETVSFLNDNGRTLQIYLAIGNENGAGGAHTDLYVVGQETGLRATTPSGSLTEPATSPYVMTVGAACYAAAAVEPYTGRGPTIDGRTKPDVVGPDGTDSSVYGPTSGCGGSTASGFFGTSAATAHAAGAAALLSQASPWLDPSALQGVLEARATPAGTPGKDDVYGAGLLAVGTGPPTLPSASPYTGVSPVRIVDTRPQYLPVSHGDLPLGPASPYVLTVAGQSFGGVAVPANARAVVLNVTVVNPTTSSWLTVWPTGVPKPNASNLNYAGAQVVANSVTATVGANGQISFENARGTADLVVDLTGWYAPGASDGFVPLASPKRAYDSRTTDGPVGAGSTRDVKLRAWRFGGLLVPSTAMAVVLNVTAVQPTTSGYLTVFPSGTTRPTASSLNFTPGAVVPNLVVATIGDDDSVSFFNPAGLTHLVVDVIGYYVPGTGNGYVPLPTPVRDFDNRTGNGPAYGHESGTHVDLDAQNYGVPHTAAAMLLNVTVTGAPGPGWLTVYPFPPNAIAPPSSNLNYAAGQTVANAVVTRGAADGGRIALWTPQNKPYVISDLQGYFLPIIPVPPSDPIGWFPPPGATPGPGRTYLYIESPPRNEPGLGGTFLATKASYRFQEPYLDYGLQEIMHGDFDEFGVDFRASVPLAEGVFRSTWPNPNMYVSGPTVCTAPGASTYVVTDLATGPGGVLDTVNVRWDCDGQRGEFHYDASDPTTLPPDGDPATYLWQPPPGAIPATGNVFYTEGESDGRVPAGPSLKSGDEMVQYMNYTSFSAGWLPDASNHRWVVDFWAPASTYPKLTKSLYEHVGYTYNAFGIGRAVMEVTWDGSRICDVGGTFAVDDVQYVGDVLVAITIRFEVTCDGNVPYRHGFIRWAAP